MTVSNVVNATGRVGEATRVRVLAAVAELGYVPSAAARSLVGATATRIGLIYRDTDSVFISALLVAASTVSAARGLQLLIRGAEAQAPEDIAQIAQALVRSGADALLLVPPFAELLSGTPLLQELGVPVAALATGRALPDMATVRMDNRAAAGAVTELLIARGHRRIGVIGGPSSHSDSLAGMEGHRATLSAHGVVDSPELYIEGDFTFASGLAAADALLGLAPRPSAIVAANDDMAAGVLWAAHRRGLILPDDLAVTGFDDTLIATRVWPALTVVRQPIVAMTERATDLLLAALGHPTRQPAQGDVVLDFTLVERQSTARAQTTIL